MQIARVCELPAKSTKTSKQWPMGIYYSSNKIPTQTKYSSRRLTVQKPLSSKPRHALEICSWESRFRWVKSQKPNTGEPKSIRVGKGLLIRVSFLQNVWCAPTGATEKRKNWNWNAYDRLVRHDLFCFLVFIVEELHLENYKSLRPTHYVLTSNSK